MAPVGRAVVPPISGQFTVEGIPVLGLVDTGASIICMGFAIWWHYRAQWGALKQFEGTVHGAHGNPLQIAGKTEHLDIQWGEARGRASLLLLWVWSCLPASLVWALCDRSEYTLMLLMAQLHQLSLTHRRCI